MNNTDEIREMLEKRGIEWFGSTDSYETNWDAGDLTWVYFGSDNISGLGTVENDVTPEQAITATLGRACHIIEHNGDWICDACGDVVASSDPTDELYASGNAIELWDFCPYCGARIERQ